MTLRMTPEEVATTIRRFPSFFLGGIPVFICGLLTESYVRAYVYGALGGLAGTIVASTLVDWVLPFVYNIGLTGFRASVLVWLFLGGLVSLEQMYKVRS